MSTQRPKRNPKQRIDWTMIDPLLEPYVSVPRASIKRLARDHEVTAGSLYHRIAFLRDLRDPKKDPKKTRQRHLRSTNTRKVTIVERAKFHEDEYRSTRDALVQEQLQ